jgi:hypothetical protein
MRLGTTVATNAILERKGATVAYVTTKGFRDIIFVQRGNRKYHYNMSWVKPKPLAKGRDCFDVDERVDAYVNIIKALDENEVRRSTGGSRQCPRSRRSRSACSSPISTRRTSCASRRSWRRCCPARRSSFPMMSCQSEGIREGLDGARRFLPQAGRQPPDGLDAQPPRRGRLQGSDRRHELEWRRDDAFGCGGCAGQSRRVGPDRRGHREPPLGSAHRLSFSVGCERRSAH